jgi:hypothetical protein
MRVVELVCMVLFLSARQELIKDFYLVFYSYILILILAFFEEFSYTECAEYKYNQAQRKTRNNYLAKA